MNLGLLPEKRRETDWELKGAGDWKPILPHSNYITWRNYKPAVEYQWKKGVETNACVSFSANNQIEFLANYEIERDSEFRDRISGLLKEGKANFSDRRTAKGSGTDPNSGNYVSAVEDYIRHNWFCPEDMWPFPSGMSLREYYKPMPVEVRDYGKNYVKPVFDVQYKFLPMDGFRYWEGDAMAMWQKYTFEGLRYSPVWVSVLVPYKYHNNLVSGKELAARLKAGDNRVYGHRVVIYGAKWGEYWEVFDHYYKADLRFEWDYMFSWRKVARIVKKPMPRHILIGRAIASLGLGGRFKNKYLYWLDGDDLKFQYGDYSRLNLVRLEKEPPNLDKKHALVIVNYEEYEKLKKSRS